MQELETLQSLVAQIREKGSPALPQTSLKRLENYLKHLENVSQADNIDDKELNYWEQQLESLIDLLQKAQQGHEIAFTQLKDAFYTDLEFGTGGMRGLLGPGSNRVNLFTIGKATLGFGNWLQDTYQQRPLAVVIAYDCRRLSYELALKSALILAAQGIKAHLFQEIAPTPLLSYAVRRLKAQGGIMVTASHNPSEYNGYKVYRHDGCQVPPPKDKDIIDYVNRVDGYNALSPQEAQDKDLLHFLDNEIDTNYTAELAQRRFVSQKGSLRIGFTPLHGTGGRLVPRLLQEFDMGEVMVVPSQQEPNGNFPTVTYPNPEEGAALEELIKMGRENKLDLLMANDPDADRVGIAVWDKEKGDYIILNGNQTGSLLVYYFLEQWQKKGLPQDAVIIKTIVTTELQREIGESFGVRVLDTLTGFKYIGDWLTHFENTGNGSYIFGGEESYGYLPEDFIRDKDGLSACYFIAEAANYYASQGKSLLDQLNDIYRKYHLYVEKLFTEKFPGQKGMQDMAAIVDQARNNPPASLAGEALLSSYDIQNQQVTDLKSGQIRDDKGLPPSNVVQFTLEDGSRVTLRPSGTEPKIKFYFSVKGNIQGLNAKEAKAQEENIHQRIYNMMEDFREQIIHKALK